jgi:transcriptional regulator with XRE-family HTH domain
MAKPSPRYSKHPVLKDLGHALQQRRLAAGQSQEDLAEAAGVDRSYLGGIERGEHNMTLLNLKRLADALGVSISVLMNEIKL